MCLCVAAVIGICEKLVSNFRLWKAGFPDLIMWNVLIPKVSLFKIGS